MLAIPASFVNSMLDYLNKQLAICFRTELTKYTTNLYMKDMVFYQIVNLDSRTKNPDQYLTSNIEVTKERNTALQYRYISYRFQVPLFTNSIF